MAFRLLSPRLFLKTTANKKHLALAQAYFSLREKDSDLSLMTVYMGFENCPCHYV